MAWWETFKRELRSVLGPYGTGDPALRNLFGGGPTSSNEPVSVERALGSTAVWSCVSLIAGTVAAMPLVLYQRGEDGERERYRAHPLHDVLALRPNPVTSCMAFWESMLTSLLLRGNAFAAVTRDDDGRVRALWYVNPDRVQVDVMKTGTPRYRVSAGASTQVIPANGMLHISGPMSDDGLTGRSVISTFRETLGLGLATERYSAEFFSNAATPRGVLKTPGRLSGPARENLMQSLDANHAARGRRHKTMVLEEGVEFQSMSMSAEDSQLIESRRFTTEEVARIFLVPPHMVGANSTGSSTTYSNAETEGLRLLKHTLWPWMSRIESAVNFSLISPLERRTQYAEYLPDSLLATDTAGRYAAYKTGLEAGFLTVDEVRAKENMPALTERVPVLK